MPLENTSLVTIPATVSKGIINQTATPPYLVSAVEETQLVPYKDNNVKIFLSGILGYENTADFVSISLSVKDFTINLDNVALPL